VFDGSRLKIERANHHIDDLEARTSAFAADECHTVTVEHDTNAGYDLLKLTVAKSVPDGFALIIGDAMHNLMAALDFAIGDIEFATTGERDRYTKFPIYETREKLETSVNGGLKHKIPPAIINHIVDTIQPYSGGNGDSIYALYRLDIEDKHKILIPYLQTTAIFDFCAESDTGDKISISPWVVLRNHTSIHHCIGQRNVKITNKGKPAIGIFFDNGLPVMQGYLVIPTLRQFAADVIGIIEGIGRVFSP
jgi:hypothetical protein